jgi:3-oxoacyl-[acyl-carrier protein] reductase
LTNLGVHGHSARYLKSLFALDGRVAVVTGAGGGLGRVFARSLAAAGATVVAVDIREAAAEETAQLLRTAGASAEAIPADVSDDAEVIRLASRLESLYPHVNVLVNNAGISTPSRRVHEIAVDEWDEVIRVNLRSAFLCTRAIVPMMFEAESTSIINISSVVGVRALDPSIISQAAYVASKAAIVGLTMQTAADYGSIGIRANAIAPGWHLGTDLGKRVGNYPSPEEQRLLRAQLAQRTPLRRTGEPIELAGLVVYLASDASSFVTGQVLAHDGGWLVW